MRVIERTRYGKCSAWVLWIQYHIMEVVRMSVPRIAPVEPPYSAAADAAFARIMPPGVPPLTLFRTLAVNERVMLRVLGGGLLDRGALSMREREIVIDRTCFNCGSEYEWGVHVAFFGPRVGLGEAEQRALCSRAVDASVLSPREQQLVALCDALHATATVDDALWSALAKEWTAEQLVELVVLVGQYHTISFVTNAFALPLEGFAARFA
jgi:alkylhydroperoxidase family enzyme